MSQQTILFDVDLRIFLKKIRKFPGAKPIAHAVEGILSAASIASDIKLARGAIIALNARYDRHVDTGTRTSETDFEVLVPVSLYDMATIRYVRGTQASGSRSPIKIRQHLSGDFLNLHDRIVMTRNKYLSHHTDIKLADARVDSTVVLKFGGDGSMSIRTPEYHIREFELAEFELLTEEVLRLVRVEFGKREAVFVQLMSNLTIPNPIIDAFRSSPFEPGEFFPDQETADGYRSRYDSQQNSVTVKHLPRF